VCSPTRGYSHPPPAEPAYCRRVIRRLVVPFGPIGCLAVLSCGQTPGPTSPSSTDPPAARIDFLGSVPGSGASLTVEGCNGRCTESLQTRFAVIPPPGVSRGELGLEFLESSGRACATALTTTRAMPPSRATNFESALLELDPRCPVPFTTTLLRASLLVAGEPHLQGDFASSYAFRAPELSATPTEPRIARLRFKASGPDPTPRSGDPVTIECLVDDRDGDGVTLELSLEQGGGGWLSINGEASAVVRSYCPPQPYPHHFIAIFHTLLPTDALVTARARDSRGAQSRSASIEIPVR